MAVVLHGSALGRLVYVMGNNLQAARYSGVRVARVKMALFIASGTVSALAGLLYAARLGSVRGDMAQGFELDIITVVLLGGVSIFGGSGNLVGVGLSILVILNLRNGMGLADITGNTQTSVIGALLILSVLVPNMARLLHTKWKGRELMKQLLLATAAVALMGLVSPHAAKAQMAPTPGKSVEMVLLPKFLGILPKDFLPPVTQPSLSALDVGCGTGATAVRLAQLGIHVTLLDSSPAMLDIAKRVAGEAGVADEVWYATRRCYTIAELVPHSIVRCNSLPQHPGILRGPGCCVAWCSSRLARFIGDIVGSRT